MAEFFIDPENGSESGAGTIGDPWKLIPGQTNANLQPNYTTVAGTIYSVRNGTVSNLRVSVPADNLTYRGYGLADNVLTLTQPVKGRPYDTYEMCLVREPGVHEGMWELTGNGTDTGVFSIGGNRSGVVVEDCFATHPLDSVGTCIYGASTTTTCTNFTVRRCRSYGGVYGYLGGVRTVTFDGFLVESTLEESIYLSSTAATARAGNDTFLRICSRDAARKTTAQGGLGDAIQVDRSGTVPSSYLGRLLIDGLYVDYQSTTKQTIKFYDATNTITLRNFHFRGQASGILLHDILGVIRIEDGYIYQATTFQQPVRMALSDANQNLLGVNAKVIVRNIIADIRGTGNQFFSVGSGGVTGAIMAGSIILEGNTVLCSSATSGLTFAGVFSVYNSASAVYQATFKFEVRNNVVIADGLSIPVVFLQPGWLNSANCPIENNVFPVGATYKSDWNVVYSTLAAFEAAHSTAVNNQEIAESAVLIGTNYAPLPASPLLGAGVHTTYKRDITGIQRPNPPSIGAYDLPTHRRELDSDPAGW